MFKASRTGGSGIFTGNGITPVTKINGQLTGNFTTDLGVPTLNDSGYVAFVAYDATKNVSSN
jgi:hypothetical protein